jgi:hypothetical protein
MSLAGDRLQRMAAIGTVGIAPADLSAQVVFIQCVYGDGKRCRLGIGWEDASVPPELMEVVERWQVLPNYIVQAILAMVRSYQG